MKRILLVVALLCASVAQAQVNPYWGHVVENGGAIVDVIGGKLITDGRGGPTFVGRTFSAPSPGTQSAYRAFATETLSLPGMAADGGSLAVQAVRGITLTELAGALALAGAVGAVAFDKVGSPLAKALGYDEFTMGDTRCTAHYQGWQCDDGGAPVSQDVVQYQFGNANWGQGSWSIDPQAACASVPHPGSFQMVFKNPSPNVFQCYWDDDGNIYNGGTLAYASDQRASSTFVCPSVVDALNPAWSKPSGGAVGRDGKCPTGRYNHAENPAVAARIASYGDLGIGAPDVAAHIVNDLHSPIEVHDPSSLSGPSSTVGHPEVSTKTNPDGSTETTTKTASNTYNYTSAPNTVTVTNSTQTITNTCVAAGSCTTTTVGTVAVPVIPPTKLPDAPTDCDKHPGSVACTDLGDPGSAEPPPNVDIPTAVQNIVFGSMGGCPAPFQLAFSVGGRGYSYTISNQPLCDLMVTMQPIFLALFAAAAAFVFYDGIGKATA